jgi:hypothetical protein
VAFLSECVVKVSCFVTKIGEISAFLIRILNHDKLHGSEFCGSGLGRQEKCSLVETSANIACINGQLYKISIFK